MTPGGKEIKTIRVESSDTVEDQRNLGFNSSGSKLTVDEGDPLRLNRSSLMTQSLVIKVTEPNSARLSPSVKVIDTEPSPRLRH